MKLILTCCIVIVSLTLGTNKDQKPDQETVNDFSDVLENRKPNIFVENNDLQSIDNKNEPKPKFTYGNGPKGPNHWYLFFPECGGAFQSPININLKHVHDVQLDQLVWGSGYEQIPNMMTATNNGRTIYLKAAIPANTHAQLSGGPLTMPYTFEELHFHWGDDERFGSEHRVDNKAFAMEMHCLHQRSDISFEKAVITPNGLAVVAYFFEISSKDNPVLDNIIVEMSQLGMQLNTQIQLVNTFKLQDIVTQFTDNYVTYKGSLTTPPCSETVIWIISPYPQRISSKQLIAFQKVAAATGMTNNFRPTQPVGNRTVYFVT